MRIKNLGFLLIIAFWIYDASSRTWYSEDHMVMNDMTKSIGPKNNRDLYFVRPNDVIPYDSIVDIVNQLYKDDFDSIRVELRPTIDFCGNYYANGHKIIHYSFMMYWNRLLRHKHFSLNVYADTTIGLLGISSQRWQYGFIEPPQSNNRFASEVKDRLLEKYPDAEYTGFTEMKYAIEESDSRYHRGEVRFWKWFKSYEKYLFDYERRPEIIDRYLDRKLQIMGLDLSFEVGQVKEGKREFNIYGPEYMRERTIKTTPELQFWRIEYITGKKKRITKTEEAREENQGEEGGGRK